MIDRYSVHFIKLIVKTFHFGVYWPLLETTCIHCAPLVGLYSTELLSYDFFKACMYFRKNVNLLNGKAERDNRDQRR